MRRRSAERHQHGVTHCAQAHPRSGPRLLSRARPTRQRRRQARDRRPQAWPTLIEHAAGPLIFSDPNRSDDEQYIIRLIGQVVTVSVETMELITSLPSLDEPRPAPFPAAPAQIGCTHADLGAV